MQKLNVSWACGLSMYVKADKELDLDEAYQRLNYWHERRHSKRFKEGATYQAFLEQNPDYNPEACTCDEPVL